MICDYLTLMLVAIFKNRLKTVKYLARAKRPQ